MNLTWQTRLDPIAVTMYDQRRHRSPVTALRHQRVGHKVERIVDAGVVGEQPVICNGHPVQQGQNRLTKRTRRNRRKVGL